MAMCLGSDLHIHLDPRNFMGTSGWPVPPEAMGAKSFTDFLVVRPNMVGC